MTHAKEYKTEVAIAELPRKKRSPITSHKLKELAYIVKTEVSFMQEGQTLVFKIRRIR